MDPLSEPSRSLGFDFHYAWLRGPAASTETTLLLPRPGISTRRVTA